MTEPKRMGGVPAAVTTKVTPRKTLAISAGVPMPTTGKGNPMPDIKSKSGGKGGGMATCNSGT